MKVSSSNHQLGRTGGALAGLVAHWQDWWRNGRTDGALGSSVVDPDLDPDPVGSKTFGRIRIRKK